MNLPLLDWNARITTLPDSHLLQTAEWGRFKALYGWEVLPQLWLASGERYDTGNEPLSEEVRAAALVLQRTTAFGWLPFNLRLLYVPKGPLLDWSDLPVRRKVLADLKQLAHQQRAIFIKIDPDIRLGTGVPGGPDELPDPTGQAVEEDLQASGWRYSPEQVQFRNTVLIDLVHPEEELLAVMKQKTRYNIRLSVKKGVTVRPGEAADLETLYLMYAETSVRDGFVIRDRAYYLQLWNSFISAGMAEPLVAEWGGQPVAGLVLFHFAGRAYFLHGMSRDEHREKMPGYLLQWEAMRRAKALGCRTYDLWGAPEIFAERDPLWGVYRFKDGFNGQVVRTLGAYDYPINPVAYRLYTQVLPRLLDVMRRLGRRRTAQSLGA